jgi:ribosome biogenesis GTPase / thiamine phosphate phosphatase
VSSPLTIAEKAALEELGWSDSFGGAFPADPALRPARVVSVYAARVDLWTLAGPRMASLRGRALRDAPIEGGVAVGDWVAIGAADATDVVVEAILPRRTAFLRQAAGERAEPQAIAANVDRVFVVTAVDRDFNLRRVERYLVAIAAGGAEAQIVLTKADLLPGPDLDSLLAEVSALAPAFLTSARDGRGMDELTLRISRGTTAALVGSSGVGKSALVNQLLGREAQLEGAVREHDGRGRHTTTRRELFVLPRGGLLIDTPGMRELKPWLPDGEISDDAFEDVTAVAEACRYRDCLHRAEPGCAVRAAIEAGDLPEERALSWQKLVREASELTPRQASSATVAEKRRARSMAVALRRRVREKDG